MTVRVATDYWLMLLVKNAQSVHTEVKEYILDVRVVQMALPLQALPQRLSLHVTWFFAKMDGIVMVQIQEFAWNVRLDRGAMVLKIWKTAPSALME